MKRRQTYLERIDLEFEVNPVVAILGPRQREKATLSKQYITKKKVPDSPSHAVA